MAGRLASGTDSCSQQRHIHLLQELPPGPAFGNAAWKEQKPGTRTASAPGAVFAGKVSVCECFSRVSSKECAARCCLLEAWLGVEAKQACPRKGWSFLAFGQAKVFLER